MIDPINFHLKSHQLVKSIQTNDIQPRKNKLFFSHTGNDIERAGVHLGEVL